VAIDLTVPDLDELQRRRSEKWSLHPPGVLSATVAEMDFPIAEPIARVLGAAIDRSDLGYAVAAGRRCASRSTRSPPAAWRGPSTPSRSRSCPT
jgi:bifunctional pyridoxal-dependent enzyme with beta-cystathionase and maltose regulon repressor activities